MKPCISCGELTVDPEEPPLYDVLNPDYDPGDDMNEIGPYCTTCWAGTPTEQAPPPEAPPVVPPAE